MYMNIEYINIITRIPGLFLPLPTYLILLLAKCFMSSFILMIHPTFTLTKILVIAVANRGSGN